MTGRELIEFTQGCAHLYDIHAEKLATVDEIAEKLEARNDRSAWSKGVTAYALELLDNLRDTSAENVREALLNGAHDWSEYSYGGSALIYDCDIAERLCTPSELKRTRNGERNPNSRESWLDVQTRALCQAATRVICARRAAMAL